MHRMSLADCKRHYEDIDEITKTSSSFIESLYFVAHEQMKQKFEKQEIYLWQKSGEVLRIDHTYKVVKNVSAYCEETQTRVCILKFKL